MEQEIIGRLAPLIFAVASIVLENIKTTLKLRNLLTKRKEKEDIGVYTILQIGCFISMLVIVFE